MHISRALATFFGLLALLFWSTGIAVSRSQTLSFGVYLGGALACLIGGGLGAAWILISPKRRSALRSMPWPQGVLCGALFVTCVVCLRSAVGEAATNQQTLTVGIINYLWPSLTLALSIFIVRMRARAWVILGMALALSGIAIATSGEGFSWQSFAQNLRANSTPYLLALAAAVSWSFYSPLSRRWAPGASSAIVPFLLIIAGVVLAAIGMFKSEEIRWSYRAVAELLFLALFPTLLSYSLWDIAVKKGHIALVTVASNFIPIFSTIISVLYLKSPPGSGLILGCLLVTAGAIICRASVREPATLK